MPYELVLPRSKPIAIEQDGEHIGHSVRADEGPLVEYVDAWSQANAIVSGIVDLVNKRSLKYDEMSKDMMLDKETREKCAFAQNACLRAGIAISEEFGRIPFRPEGEPKED